VRACVRACVCVCVYVYVCVCVRVRACVLCVYARARAHTHTHTHTHRGARCEEAVRRMCLLLARKLQEEGQDEEGQREGEQQHESIQGGDLARDAEEQSEKEVAAREEEVSSARYVNASALPRLATPETPKGENNTNLRRETSLSSQTSKGETETTSRRETVTSAQGARAMLDLICSTAPPLAGRTTDAGAWRWPPSRRLMALTSLLRILASNVSDSVGAGSGGGLGEGGVRERRERYDARGVAGSDEVVDVGTVAAAAAAIAEAAAEVGLGGSASSMALEALGAVFPLLTPPGNTHGNATSSAAEREGMEAHLSIAVMMLARLCARDAHFECRAGSAESANAVSTVARMAHALAARHSAAAARGYVHVSDPRIASGTAQFLLKACAQGGGGVRGAEIALEQLERLAAAPPLHSQLSPPQDSVDGSDSGKGEDVLLVLAALASRCRFLSPRVDSRRENAPEPMPRSTTASAHMDVVSANAQRLLPVGESVWGAALEVWDRLDAWGESARQQPAALAMLATVLEAAARAGDRTGTGNATWHLHAVAQLCMRAAALPQGQDLDRGGGGASGNFAEQSEAGQDGREGRGSYEKALASLVAAAHACVRGLGAQAGSVAFALRHAFACRHGARLSGHSLGALLSCFFASSRPGPTSIGPKSADDAEEDDTCELREAVATLLVAAKAHTGGAVSVPAVGDRLGWLRAGVQAVDEAWQIARAQDGSGGGAGARVRGVLPYAVPGLIAHVRGLVRALRFETDKWRGAEAEVIVVLSRLHAMVVADMPQLAGNCGVVSQALLSARVLINLNLTFPGTLAVAPNVSAALSADADVNGTGSECLCPWRVAKLWIAVLLSPMAPPGRATDDSAASARNTIGHAEGASAAAGRLRARCMEIWVQMCLEAARQERQLGWQAHGDGGHGCQCGGLQGGGVAEARDALARWDNLQGAMSLKLVYVRLMLLLAPPKGTDTGQDKTPRLIDQIQALCTLLTQASQLVDSSAGRGRKTQDRAAKLVTRIVRLVASRLFRQLKSLKNSAPNTRRSSKILKEEAEALELATGAQQHALKVSQLLEQLLLSCNHNQVGVATEAIEALGNMLSQLADIREQACARERRGASASVSAKSADKESIMKVEWHLLASVAQAALQAWARPRKTNSTYLWDADAEGGDGQLSALGNQTSQACSLLLAGSGLEKGDNEDGMRWLSADAATGLLRLHRKGIITDEWHRRRVVRQAQVLVAYVAPTSLSDSLAAEMILTLGGKHGGASDQSAVLAMISRARIVGVASGKVTSCVRVHALWFAFVLGLCALLRFCSPACAPQFVGHVCINAWVFVVREGAGIYAW
jgi:hypothetical protein